MMIAKHWVSLAEINFGRTREITSLHLQDKSTPLTSLTIQTTAKVGWTSRACVLTCSTDSFPSPRCALRLSARVCRATLVPIPRRLCHWCDLDRDADSLFFFFKSFSFFKLPRRRWAHDYNDLTYQLSRFIYPSGVQNVIVIPLGRRNVICVAFIFTTLSLQLHARSQYTSHIIFHSSNKICHFLPHCFSPIAPHFATLMCLRRLEIPYCVLSHHTVMGLVCHRTN
jgi:hypothetical protein